MDRLPDEKLDRLLKDAFPQLEPSSDFRLNLWRRLISPGIQVRPVWALPAPAYAMAAAVGLFFGVLNAADLHRPAVGFERLDLFGNAPVDTVAGSFLNLTKEGSQ